MTDSISARSSVSSHTGVAIAPQKNDRPGMTWKLTAFFLVAQMAGAGFLSLPMALRNTGWIGILMMIVFCAAVGLSGTRLGSCWVILEERWPEVYLDQIRQPYMEIGYRAMGPHGRRLCMAAVLITLIGGTTVFMVLIAQMLNALMPALSVCEYVLIVGAVLMPFTWLGTPKDFWQASVAAVIATAFTCMVVFIELFLKEDVETNIVQYPHATFSTFSLGFGAILFAFGGASTFPTIQNDMEDRTEFWKSVIVAFMGLLTLYLPVAAAGYGVLGITVEGNILFSLEFNGIVIAAIVLEIVNLLGTYLIGFNPIGQNFEEMFNVPRKFGWKRIVIRSSIVVLEMILCLAVPDFGLILNLVGGSTVTLASFILPPVLYMLLVRSQGEHPKCKQRVIPLWEKIALWEIIIVGIIGGVSSTVFAFIAILDPNSFSYSCFTDFYYGQE